MTQRRCNNLVAFKIRKSYSILSVASYFVQRVIPSRGVRFLFLNTYSRQTHLVPWGCFHETSIPIRVVGAHMLRAFSAQAKCSRLTGTCCSR